MATTKKRRTDFPLTLHKGSGQWCKKIRNPVTGKAKIWYFGTDKGEAAKRWREEKDDIYANRTPPSRLPETQVQGGDPRTVRGAVNRFLTVKKNRYDAGKLHLRTYDQYKRSCALFVAHFGPHRLLEDLKPSDFTAYAAALTTVADGVHKGRKRGLHNMDLLIVTARSICLFAYDQGFIDHPVRFGREFRQSNKDEKRKNRQATKARYGARMFQPEEIRAVLEVSNPPQTAFYLLAINCGFGAKDIASIPKSAIDLKRGWIDFPRPKTGVARTCPLWPETIEALKVALPRRPAPKDPENEHLAFLTKFGRPWIRANYSTEEGREDILLVKDQIADTFNRFLGRLKIKRPKLSFYGLRHSFQTIADEARDPIAVSHIMGHVDHSMGGHYREQAPSEARLRAVVDVVRTWLFGETKPVEKDGNI